jgi:hypothetical protein
MVKSYWDFPPPPQHHRGDCKVTLTPPIFQSDLSDLVNSGEKCYVFDVPEISPPKCLKSHFMDSRFHNVTGGTCHPRVGLTPLAFVSPPPKKIKVWLCHCCLLFVQCYEVFSNAYGIHKHVHITLSIELSAQYRLLNVIIYLHLYLPNIWS